MSLEYVILYLWLHLFLLCTVFLFFSISLIECEFPNHSLICPFFDFWLCSSVMHCCFNCRAILPLYSSLETWPFWSFSLILLVSRNVFPRRLLGHLSLLSLFVVLPITMVRFQRNGPLHQSTHAILICVLSSPTVWTYVYPLERGNFVFGSGSSFLDCSLIYFYFQSVHTACIYSIPCGLFL